jgi:membrane protein
MEWAAAVAFYGVLSVFPLLLAGAGLASWVFPAPVVTERLATVVAGLLPSDIIDLTPIVSGAISARGQVGLVAILLWLIAGRRIFGALVTVLDRVSDVDARQETLTRRALVEVVSLIGVGLLFLAALVVHPLLRLASGTTWGAGLTPTVIWGIGAVLRVLVLVLAFFALYTVVPHGERHVRATLVGAAAATGLVLVLRAGFLAVIDRLWASYALLYGPLALAALLLTWSWLLALITLFGASLASHVKVMVLEGRDTDETESRHVAHKRPE